MNAIDKILKTEDDREWHSGPPPYIGWWNASRNEAPDPDTWRWWDGKHWSYFVFEDDDPLMVGKMVEQMAVGHYQPINGIMWTDYWPENARVPRIDPSI